MIFFPQSKQVTFVKSLKLGAHTVQSVQREKTAGPVLLSVPMTLYVWHHGCGSVPSHVQRRWDGIRCHV